uniref:Uncharacterized protein n=1 Tax=Arundo donax TaxID=35708 RepID=A0A0A9AMG8_ARUDO
MLKYLSSLRKYLTKWIHNRCHRLAILCCLRWWRSRVLQQHEPLPDSVFITSNRPSARPMPTTTATEEGRSRMQKRKAPAKNTSTAAKKNAGARAKKLADGNA